MDIKKILLILAVLAVAAGALVLARPSSPPAEPHTIGVLQYLPVMEASLQGLKDGMAKLGYVEGGNITYESRQAFADFNKLDEYAREFVNADVDLIYAIALESALSAKKEAEKLGRADIPIVFVNANDPDKLGLIGSFRSSGNQVTGVATDFVAVTAKKLEFLRQIKPDIKKIGVFEAKITDPAGEYMLAELRQQAPKFGMEVIAYPLSSPPGPALIPEIEASMAGIKPGAIDAYFHLPGPVLSIPPVEPLFAAFPGTLKIPSVFLSPSLVEQGALMSYQHDFYGVGMQAAAYVDKIFRGRAPAELPIEFQKNNVLTLNLNAAKDIGVEIPASLIRIADHVIGQSQ